MQPLPDRLRQQLDTLGRAIQSSRAAMIGSGVLLAVALAFLAALLVERFAGLSVATLRGVNAAILVAAGCGLLAAIVTFFTRRLSHAQLAQLVEQKYPGLEERLLTLATLDAAGPRVDELKQETEDRAASLDVRAAYSFGTTRQMLQLAGGAVLLVAITLVAWPTARRFADRLVHAWSDVAYGFEIEVTPAGGYAALARPLLVTAKLTGDESRFPGHCTLRVRSEKGEERLPMEATDAGLFAGVVPSMPAEVTLIVEAGERTTPPIRVLGEQAIVVTSAKLSIAPPDYVSKSLMPVETLDAGVASRPLQFSRLAWTFTFDRDPARADFTWAGKPIDFFWTGPGKELGVGAVAADVGRSSGELRVTTEHGVVTTYRLADATVWADPPPVLSDVRLGNGAPSADWTVDPDAPLRLVATLDDAVGLGRLDVEWRVNNGPIQVETLAPSEGRRLSGAWVFSPRGKVRDGDRLELRLRGVDNRHVLARSIVLGVPLPRQDPDDTPRGPSEDLLPQSVVEPATASGWFALSIKAGAAPLEKQQLLAEHDDVAAKLKAIRKEVAAVHVATTKLAAAGHISPVWTPAQSRSTQELRTKNTRNRDALSGLGAAALARLAKDIADRELGAVDRAFAKTDSSEATTASREIHLKHAETELSTALKKIDDLLGINEAVAQERLKQWEAEDLALREDALAADVAKSAEDDAARLKEQQDAITKDFEKWAAENKEIQKAKLAAQRMAAEQMAQRADKLARQQSASAAKNAEAMAERLKKALAGVAEKQAKLAQDAARLERDILAGLDGVDVPIPADAAKKAAGHLEAGAAEPALAEQSNSIAGLDRSRERLAQLVLGGDPKAAAAELIARQQKVIDDLEKLGNEFARIGPDETVKRLAEIHARQKAIEKAIDKLAVPGDRGEATAARKDASASAAEAAQGVQKRDLLPARDAMEKTRDALRRLRAALPDAPPPSDVERQKEKIRDAAREKTEALAQAQKDLREETLKTLAAAMKSEGGGGSEIAKSLDELKNDVMKLSPAKDDEKSMAKESAGALEDAAQAMKLAQDKREEGKLEMADKAERDAGLKIEQAGKMLDKLAAALPKPGENERELVQSMEAAKSLLKPPTNNSLPSPDAMQQAAKAIRKTAELTGNAMTGRSSGAAGPSQVNEDPLPNVLGQDWGNLPGEVRTRLAREWRARYGPEYEEIIQRYFRNISKSKEQGGPGGTP